MADVDLASLDGLLRSVDRTAPRAEPPAELREVARSLVAPGKGLLAADESGGTLRKRFDTVGISDDVETRRAYRQLLLTSPGLGDHVSGVILYDETIRQQTDDGKAFPQALGEQGVLPGIKADAGTKPLALSPDEQVAAGVDGLRERLAEYVELGARFAKWRAVITIGDGLPTTACLDANAHVMARYAALCQEAGVVPVVEPEVVMDGDHDLGRDAEVTESMLRETFQQLAGQGVLLEGTLLKTNMILPGKDSGQSADVDEVAEVTLEVMRRAVPAAVPGIVFLSGGQTPVEATTRLQAMNARGPHAWTLSFSYARALQEPAMAAWRGEADNVAEAQRAFVHRARCNGAAATGTYKPEMEDEQAA